MHHGIFRRLQYANGWVMRVNLLLLMAVAFLPFPTKLVAEAIRNATAERAAVIFYGASLLVISLLFSALWASVGRDRSLLKADVSEKEVEAIARATTPNLGFYVVVIVLAFIAPKMAALDTWRSRSSPSCERAATAGHRGHPRPGNARQLTPPEGPAWLQPVADDALP